MTESEYLKSRADDQIEWYGKKAAINKKWYHTFQLLTIVFGALVTLTAVLPLENYNWLKFLSPSLGAVITVSAGVLGLFRFQEKWIKYRTTCETLKIEKNLYLTKSGVYNLNNGLPLFVTRMEAIISQENSTWAQTMQSSIKDDVEAAEEQTKENPL